MTSRIVGIGAKNKPTDANGAIVPASETKDKSGFSAAVTIMVVWQINSVNDTNRISWSVQMSKISETKVQ